MSGITTALDGEDPIQAMGGIVLIDKMKQTMLRRLVRYACGTRMWCPKCNRLLDYRKAVLAGSVACCRDCWQATVDRLAAKHGTDAIVARIDAMIDETDLVDGTKPGEERSTTWYRALLNSAFDGPAKPDPRQGRLL